MDTRPLHTPLSPRDYAALTQAARDRAQHLRRQAIREGWDALARMGERIVAGLLRRATATTRRLSA